MAKTEPWAGGLKRTKQRVLVLDVLERAELPLSAPEIAAELARRGAPVWLSTIYRVLETFVEAGTVQKTVVLENGAAVYELCAHAHRHYAVCLRCRRIIPLEECPLERLEPRLCERDFHITGHRLQMYGFCGGCVEDERKKQVCGGAAYAEKG